MPIQISLRKHEIYERRMRGGLLSPMEVAHILLKQLPQETQDEILEKKWKKLMRVNPHLKN